MCIFCDIVAGNLESSTVYQDDLVTAFMDIQPVTPGHVLVIPNAHATDLAELPPDTGAQLFRVGQRVAEALRASDLRCEGVNLFLADGIAAGQEVFHVHLHVFPRFNGDGFGLRLPENYHNLPSRDNLDIIANKLQLCILQLQNRDSTSEDSHD